MRLITFSDTETILTVDLKRIKKQFWHLFFFNYVNNLNFVFLTVA